MKLYTIGYGALRSNVQLAEIVDRLDAYLVDVRFSPMSRNPHWTKPALLSLFGDRYVACRELGNENFRGGAIKLSDPPAAIARLRPLLAERPLVLMCACREVAVCHRQPAAELLAKEFGVEVAHLPEGTRQEVMVW